ncbi:alpha/beta fold hydrolase [Clostridium sp.]|uniref:alpha/beta fold hydrolase n=1 Tax=Clostridium sp. TaxID=1506 RepID=UPI003F3010A9
MKVLFKILKYIGLGLGVLIIVIISITLIKRLIKSSQIKINTVNGIDKGEYVNLGGIEQYVQIRGEDSSNPFVIFLHGGPGNTMTPTAFDYQRYLQSEYTFVNWDQRGCGRTYYNNEDLDVKTELSMDILLNDLDNLVDYIRNKFNKDKVIIMGHSWGALLGSKYILDHPEKVSNYIGVGQVVSLKDGYIYSADQAIIKANENGDKEIANKLQNVKNIFENTSKVEEFDFNNFVQMQQYTMKYNRYKGELSTFKMISTILTSPYLSIKDLQWFFKSNNPDTLLKLQEPLLQKCFFELGINDFGNKYEVPVNYITGEYDVSTPVGILEPYYNAVEAPEKSLTIIPNAGHLVFMENPEEFHIVFREILSKNKDKY